MSDIKGLGKDQDSMPDPDHPGKPEGPSDLHKRSWKYVGRKVMREFSEDQCTDQAAGLTYYAVLAMFPAALALLSLVGVVMDADKAVTKLEEVMKPLVSDDTLKTFTPVLRDLAQSQGAGLTLIIGIAGALWSASAYVSAFSRAMNRIYEIDEGRPFWKLRPWMLIITLVAVVLSALVLAMLVVSGKLAESIGDTIGLGSTAVTVWSIAKWPVLLVMVMLAVAVLYYATPNIKQPKFRWISVGAGFAIVIWVLASVAFAFYVASFGNYNKTYGSLAGVIVALLWLWITNLALLLGAEIDSELERGRELQAGIPAEEELQLPARDTRNIEKAREKEQKDIKMGRSIREQADPDGEVAAQYGDTVRQVPGQSAGRTDDATGAGSTSTSPGRN
ncbi:MAG TPA: YihY/virulence factor BrkB family protein [Marmoricola sp.]|nr:YihY/virulence factor BrkB family protein [Marmoricola sp.]